MKKKAAILETAAQGLEQQLTITTKQMMELDDKVLHMVVSHVTPS